MPDLTYHPAASRELRAYLAIPRGQGPWPGVVVVMDAFGLSDDIRGQADRLATAGYLAFAPNLYSGRGIRCVVATMQSSRTGSGEAYEDIEGARQWLSARDDCTGRIGIIGFCMGGGFALLCAPRYDFSAASVNYGEVPEDAVQRLAGACPVVASYGRRDRGLQGRAERLEGALLALGIAHDVKEYPDAGHSFLNRLNAGPAITPLMKFVGLGYHHPSAEDAWGRILDFFDTHLRDGAPAHGDGSDAAG
jgi:carboxymethylenebutenolidase